MWRGRTGTARLSLRARGMRHRAIAVLAALSAFGLVISQAAKPPAPKPTARVVPADDTSSAKPQTPPDDTDTAADTNDHLLLIDEGAAVSLIDGREIELSVTPDQGEQFSDLAKRFGGDPARAAALVAANPDVTLPAPTGSTTVIRVPWELLREEYRYIALRTIFPADRFSKEAWVHDPNQARAATLGEGLWQVAVWFTGDGDNWKQIATANGIAGADVPRGRTIRVPRSLLLPRFLPAPATQGPLRYGEDKRGAYAEYRLQKGEALYSAVVARFTGLLSPDDVLDAARSVAMRSGIRNVRNIPVGQRIRIPLDLLAPNWLPENDPRRIAAAMGAQELAEAPMPPPPSTFQGLHVLIDPGHGGDDIGARSQGIWESDYVYDIACRLKRLLDGESGVTVHMLVADRQHGCSVVDQRALVANRREVVLTTPPHVNTRGDAVDVGVNLRWALANSIFRELTTAQSVPPENVVFLSLHADSLHPSVRGGMVYVPGERFRRGSFALNAGAYGRYKEVRGVAPVSFSRAERLRDEAVSRRLATALLEGYRAEQLPIHDNQPVRDSIVRGRRKGRAWLPAVLRGNMVPAKVLLETVNINNQDDARLLQDPAGRERLARAVVNGLRSFYSGQAQRSAPGSRSGR